MQKQKGFSLLEILITLVIISFGLLGIAGVIVNSLKNNQSSYSRSQASLLANDIIDRMRANRTTAETSPSPYTLAIGGTPSGSGVVLSDLTEWRASLASAMPSGTGSVALDGATKKLTIVVQWNDSRASGDTTTFGLSSQQITVETRL
ncbi:MAG: type IV pilus modification protein PilV [Oxalobacteraceae bacterium]|nr:type IV pilus modification protein PilV [Oxalobacteraceae bacterium]